MFSWLRRLLNRMANRPDATRPATGKSTKSPGPKIHWQEEDHPTPRKKKEPVFVRGKHWVNTAETGWVLAPEPQDLDEPSIEGLLKKLGQVDQRDARRSAAEALGQMGADATPAITALLNAAVDIDESVREAACNALDAIHPDWPQTEQARPAFPNLVEALHSWSAEVKEAAFGLLKRIGPPAAPALEQALLEGEDTIDKVYVMQLLAQIGPDAAGAVPGLTKELSSKHAQARIAAADALAQIGPEAAGAVPLLTDGLSDPYPSVRQAMAACLAELGPRAEPALPALLPLLADREPDIRKSAAEALEHIGSAAVPSLIEVLQARDVQRLKVRLEALMTVSRWHTSSKGDRLVTEPFQVWANRYWAAYSILEEQEALEEAQISALQVLGRLGPTAAVARPAIIQTLVDPNPHIRLSAIQALEQIDALQPDILPDLIRMLVDKNADVRDAATDSLKGFNAKSGADEWITDPAAADAMATLAKQLNQPDESAAQAFVAIGPAAVPTLIHVLESGDRVAQEKAAKVLGQIGPNAAAATPALNRALQDSHPWVQAEAAAALEKITGHPAADH